MGLAVTSSPLKTLCSNFNLGVYMEDAIDYIENLYSDYYQNQDNKSLEEIRALALAKLKAEHNSDYAKCNWAQICIDGIGSWWESSCGVNGDSPDDSFIFCPLCGGKIEKHFA